MLNPLPSAPDETRASLFARIGDAMQRHPGVILSLQAVMVVLYGFLLLAPSFFLLFDGDASSASRWQQFAQLLFWGIGWPLIIVSMMLFGRVWCGIFCPDGTLTETVSRYGRHGSIPRWIRWRGWSCTLLVATTVYGQMTSAYDSYPATLLLLGLPTLGALLTGFFYGNGRRIWCMYLCPANGVFALLAKLAPVHFRVDPVRWKAYPDQPPRVVCPPLIDIQRMTGAADCHACGRCSGYRQAVEWAVRAPEREILNKNDHSADDASVTTLLFGMLGVGTLAMTWQNSRWFACFEQWLVQALQADWLRIGQQHAAPWWLLANYPQAGRVFPLFDGIALLLVLLAGGGLLALVLAGLLWLAGRWAADPSLRWQRLSLALVPIAGTGLVLGVSLFIVKHFRAEGWQLAWVPGVQATILAAGGLFSLWLCWRMNVAPSWARRWPTLAFFMLPVALLVAIWTEKLF